MGVLSLVPREQIIGKTRLKVRYVLVVERYLDLLVHPSAYIHAYILRSRLQLRSICNTYYV
jgi:hypothetical protein